MKKLNIVEIISRDGRLAIVMRDVAADMFECHFYRKGGPNGEYERIPDRGVRSVSAAAVCDAARDFATLGVMPIRRA